MVQFVSTGMTKQMKKRLIDPREDQQLGQNCRWLVPPVQNCSGSRRKCHFGTVLQQELQLQCLDWEFLIQAI